MTTRLKRLELTWIGKEDRPRLEPRILLEDSAQSYRSAVKHSENDLFDNRLIHGDNLLALKALEQEFAGRIKCIYIDPPFNTGQAFPEYNDGVEHSLWLSLMAVRLRHLHALLADNGALFVEIDDTESSYLQILLDEVFGRRNRILTVTVKRSAATGHKAINPTPVNVTEYIHIYAKDKASWRYKPTWVPRGDYDKAYKTRLVNPTAPFAEWTFEPLAAHVAAICGFDDTRSAKRQLGAAGFEAKFVEYALGHPSEVVRFAQPDYKAVSKAAQALIDQSKARPGEVLRLEREGYSDMYFVDGNRVLFLVDKVEGEGNEAALVEPLTNWWDDIPWQGIAAEGGVTFPKNKKPEKLVKRILDMCTEPGDWVLDSVAGSGTTGAVAHKMRRRWIMVELGEHCESLIVPRMKHVIDGTDSTGVTNAAAWSGGGGFRYYRLAASLLEKDKWGNWIVSKQYRPEMLAEAMCKLEGFRYAPDSEVFWNHGHSTERDLIYVTTQSLGTDQLRFISEQVGSERTLLICCGAFRGKADFPNLTVKKIPQAVLARCEWGRDDYSLNVTDQAPVVAVGEAKAEDISNDTKIKAVGRRRKATPVQALPLFANIDNGNK